MLMAEKRKPVRTRMLGRMGVVCRRQSWVGLRGMGFPGSTCSKGNYPSVTLTRCLFATWVEPLVLYSWFHIPGLLFLV